MIAALLLAACRIEGPAPPPVASPPPNVLILVLDDVGVDRISAYGIHPTPSTTPRIDALIHEGVRFDRAYASPSCSPSRASILTGRQPSRHKIGTWIAPWFDPYTLADSEITLAEVARGAGRSTAAIGKWHVSSFIDRDPTRDPQDQGFDHFRGILGNPNNAFGDDGLRRSHYHWERDDDGVLSFSDTWLGTAQVDDALAMVGSLSEPWVVYVGFSAPHTPLDSPPPDLAVPASDDAGDLYDAILEALDAEIGRLLDGMSAEVLDRTTIITIGDNGTPDHGMREPWDPLASKMSMTEGGIRVPLAVTGAGVTSPGGVSEALVHAVDVFATVADSVGADLGGLTIDGVSLWPMIRDPSDPGPRSSVIVEHFYPDGDLERDGLARAAVEPGWKLLRQLGVDDELTAVGLDPSQETPGVDEAAMARLRAELERFEGSVR